MFSRLKYRCKQSASRHLSMQSIWREAQCLTLITDNLKSENRNFSVSCDAERQDFAESWFQTCWWRSACFVWSSCWESTQSSYLLTYQRLWSIEWMMKMRMQNFRSTIWWEWQSAFLNSLINRSRQELDMRWLDHRLLTSKTEFSFQIISAQIARLRCECLLTQLIRCFLDSDIVANNQLRDISACNWYEEKRNVWHS